VRFEMAEPSNASRAQTVSEPGPKPRPKSKNVLRHILIGYVVITALLSYLCSKLWSPLGWLPLAASVAFISRFVFRIWKFAGSDFQRGESSIKTLPSYQDADLIAKGFEFAPWKPQQVFYQPVEGYCGHATVNTVLQSINQKPLPLPKIIRPFSLSGLRVFLEGNVLPSTPSIQSVQEVSGSATYSEFLSVLRDLERPDVRLMCNFLRLPLFFADQPRFIDRAKTILNGHWSPLVSVLWDDGLVLIADVNESYGPYLVPLPRLYQAVHTRDTGTGAFRGLIKITLKQCEE